MESTEFYAKLLFYARMLGGEKEIPCGEVKKLVELRKQFGVPGKHPMEKLCPGCAIGTAPRKMIASGIISLSSGIPAIANEVAIGG